LPTPRKDLSEHKLQGTKPKYVEEPSTLQPGRPRYPKGLSPDEKKAFKHFSRLLEQRRALTEGDGESLRLLAVVFVRWQKAIQMVAQQGEIRVYTRLDKFGVAHDSERPNLWLKVAQDSEKFVQSQLDRLGLTPMNRGKVKPAEVPKGASPEQSAEDALMSREAAALLNDEPDLEAIDLSRVM
jgi:phage terminase small subunit